MTFGTILLCNAWLKWKGVSLDKIYSPNSTPVEDEKKAGLGEMSKKVCAVLLLLLVFITGCGGKAAEEQPAEAAPESKGKVAPVMTVKIQSEPLLLSAMAVARPGREAELSFNASGTISRMNAVVGKRVDKGQLLAVLDAQTAGSRTARQLDIEDARRTLARAQEDFQRYQALHDAGAVPAVELENKQLALENAASRLDRAQIGYEDTALTAPFAGTVVKVSRREGETAGPGAPVIKIVDLSQIKLTLDVDGVLVNNFNSGQKVKIAREDGVQAEGTVTSVALLTDTATGKYPVEINLGNADGGWRGGMTAQVEVPRTLATGIVVPLSALGLDEEKRFVLVVENGLAKKCYVKVGQVMTDDIEILSGLTEGQRVITGGIAYIVAGEKIVAKGE